MMKKMMSYLVLGMIAFFLCTNTFAAEGLAEVKLCDANVMKVFRIGGYVLIAVKIIVPILIIVFGMIDFTKAIVLNDQDQVKKSTMSLAKRAIAGIIIFFLPTLINTLFDFIYEKTNTNVFNYESCWGCVFDPGSCRIDE